MKPQNIMKNSTFKILSICIFLILVSLLAGCGTEEEVIETPTPTPTLPPEQEEIWELWEGSNHADTYALEKGPNTYCAKCHSPENWDYSATIDPPPNCLSCKLTSEDEPRIAEGNPLVAEEDWMDIGCEVCHQMNGRLANPEYYWYDNSTGYYEVVSSTTELCEKCHTNTKTELIMHERDMGDEVHVGFTCTDCHDPHDPFATCSDCHLDIVMAENLPAQQHIGITDKARCLGCHTEGMNIHSMEIQRTGEKDCLVCHDDFNNLTEDEIAPVYHSGVHDNVDCIACHDGSGMEIGISDDNGELTVFRTINGDFGQITEEYQSHNLTTKVDCTKCHYADNPWDIPESIIATDGDTDS